MVRELASNKNHDLKDSETHICHQIGNELFFEAYLLNPFDSILCFLKGNESLERCYWIDSRTEEFPHCIDVSRGSWRFLMQMGLCLLKNCCWFSTFQELMFLEVIPRFQESWYSNRFGKDFKLSCPIISNKWKDLDSSQTNH